MRTTEGSGTMPLAGGGELRPTLDAGLRYDGGDAETGAGLELGSGLAYRAGALAVQVDARGLVAHEDTEYEEWGFSGSVAYRPGSHGRGLDLKLDSAWGATQSGESGLRSRETANGLARSAPMAAAQRFEAEFGYGLEGRRERTELLAAHAGFVVVPVPVAHCEHPLDIGIERFLHRHGFDLLRTATLEQPRQVEADVVAGAVDPASVADARTARLAVVNVERLAELPEAAIARRHLAFSR